MFVCVSFITKKWLANFYAFFKSNPYKHNKSDMAKKIEKELKGGLFCKKILSLQYIFEKSLKLTWIKRFFWNKIKMKNSNWIGISGYRQYWKLIKYFKLRERKMFLRIILIFFNKKAIQTLDDFKTRVFLWQQYQLC